MSARLFSTATVSAVLVAMSAHGVEVRSEFDSSNEGWIGAEYSSDTFVYHSAQTAAFNATGGNPGGYISVADAGGFTWYMAAPTEFLGDVSWAYGGTLSVDRMNTGGPIVVTNNELVLMGAGLILVFDDAPVTSTWSTSVVPVQASAGWERHTGETVTYADLVSVLSNLDALLVRVEHVQGPEVASVDNVILQGNAPTSAQSSIKGVSWARVKNSYDSTTGN